jgi:hypothetical protein
VCYVSLRTERERKRNMMNVVRQIKQKTQQEENETRDGNTEMDRQRRWIKFKVTTVSLQDSLSRATHNRKFERQTNMKIGTVQTHKLTKTQKISMVIKQLGKYSRVDQTLRNK